MSTRNLPYEPNNVSCHCSCGRNVVGCRTTFPQPHSEICEETQWFGLIDKWKRHDEWYRDQYGQWDRNDNGNWNRYRDRKYNGHRYGNEHWHGNDDRNWNCYGDRKYNGHRHRNDVCKRNSFNGSNAGMQCDGTWAGRVAFGICAVS